MKLVKSSTVDKWLLAWAKATIRATNLDAPVDAATRAHAKGEMVAYSRIFLDLAGGYSRYWEHYLTARNNRVQEMTERYLADLATVAKFQPRNHH